ncbi:MAG: hypothetical protein RLZZ200_1714 [Pseudomonadota bacterium]|jgi:3-methylfumaryl-CoA hydratase
MAGVRRIAAMLDLDPSCVEGSGLLPRGWQFMLLGGETQRSRLRADGFPGLGPVLPGLDLPRLLLGGRSVSFVADIPVGAELVHTSEIEKAVGKGDGTNPMTVITVRHELSAAGGAVAALVERQTYVLMAQRAATSRPADGVTWTDVVARTCVTPDDTMLFQYSALGFNSHRIHVDRDFARNVEGYEDLVVNGGLSTLLMTEFARNELGLVPRSLATRHFAPLYCGREMHLSAERLDDKWRFRACDEKGILCAEMVFEPKGPGSGHV